MLLFSPSLYSAEKSELTYTRQCGWEFSPTGPALHWLLSEPAALTLTAGKTGSGKWRDGEWQKIEKKEAHVGGECTQSFVQEEVWLHLAQARF